MFRQRIDEIMEVSAIYQKLTGIFHDVFGDDSIVLRSDLTADNVDGWDSLSHIRLMVTVEKAFRVKFSASAFGKLKNVQDLVELIHSKLA
jgi:acyl carrier protein